MLHTVDLPGTGSREFKSTFHFCTYSATLLYVHHRRRIKTEEKAKVVASVLGEEFIQLLAALAVLHCMDDLNYRMNCTRMNCTRMN